MRKKTFFSAVMVFALLLQLSAAVGAAEPALLYARADRDSLKPGDTVTVTVELSGNPGFSALQFDVTYDTRVLTCTGCVTGGLLGGETLKTTNPADDGAVTVAAASLEEITADGTAAVLTFTAIGTGDAKLGLTVVSFCDENITDLDYTVRADRVTVQTVSGGETVPNNQHDIEPTMPPVTQFTDTKGHWAEANIENMAAKGLLQGFEDGSFRPDENMTRAQFAVLLWRIAGKPETRFTPDYHDLTADWYSQAVAWIAEKGYMTGRGGGTFSPDDVISRQELVTILYRYCGGAPGEELLFTSVYRELFSDSGEIAAWGTDAMYWARTGGNRNKSTGFSDYNAFS
jgi:hypothetical protein